MYEAIDTNANQTLIKTLNKFELIDYIDRITQGQVDDICVIIYQHGIVRVLDYVSFREQLEMRVLRGI